MMMKTKFAGASFLPSFLPSRRVARPFDAERTDERNESARRSARARRDSCVQRQTTVSKVKSARNILFEKRQKKTTRARCEIRD